MKPLLPVGSLLLCFAAFPLRAAETPVVFSPAASPQRDLSLREEVRHAIDRGLGWLGTNQSAGGWWSTADHPAVTAMALTCFHGDPGNRYRGSDSSMLRKGYAYVLSCVRPDGGIYVTNLVTYNTAICMMGLVTANKPEYDPILRRGRQFLIGLQSDFGEKGKLDSPFDGGIGYGSHYEHSDMGNTLAALEALYYTRHLVTDKADAGQRDLNWQAAIHFLQSCQNLPGSNPESWASDDPKNKGGFVYFPGQSMAGTETNAVTGRVALRSYGSISYGGLLSYIYADLKPDDPRVRAVLDWLRRNYTLEENPGMGKEGLFFYYHTMTKALTVAGVNDVATSDGKSAGWRQQVALKLIDLQQYDGSWLNSSGRWWEKDPALVTCYAVMALETLWRGL